MWRVWRSPKHGPPLPPPSPTIGPLHGKPQVSPCLTRTGLTYLRRRDGSNSPSRPKKPIKTCPPRHGCWLDKAKPRKLSPPVRRQWPWVKQPRPIHLALKKASVNGKPKRCEAVKGRLSAATKVIKESTPDNRKES